MRVDSVILNPKDTLRKILEALTQRLTFRDNFDSTEIDVPDSGTADTDVLVDHNLGRVPTGYIANTDAGFVYDSNRAGWTTTQATIKCSAPNAVLKLIFF